MILYKDLSQTNAIKKLSAHKRGPIADTLTQDAVRQCHITMAAGLAYNYAAKGITAELLAILQELCDEQQVIAKYQAVIAGEVMNTGEGRKVLHHLSRGQLGPDVLFEGKNLRHFYQEQLSKIETFAQAVHSGKVVGSTGQRFEHVVQIGIGGSDLGPRALCLALENLYPQKMHMHFISNVDPDDAVSILNKLDLEKSLFIIVSKSGTTQETLANYHFILGKAEKSGTQGLDLNKHIIAVTSETSPMAQNKNFLEAFFIDDFIGGRYSSSSAVGMAIMTLVFGPSVTNEFLKGAHEADKLALNPSISENAPLLDALIGVYERNVLGYPHTAILPYSQALYRFPAHLQQLDMESNGKCVNRDGVPLDYATGPIIFGEPGTNGQHSFYQLLHQGSDIIPLQFIGFSHSQLDFDVVYENSTSQEKLKANLIAQIMAFALGHPNENNNKNFAGNRPSSLIYGKRLNAQALGALLSHYENKVMFQGFLWNLNSFDQEGVQLGKVLTGKILEKKIDPITQEFVRLLDL